MGQVLLVRHGQASWGAADYDVLSETGWEQGRLLGRSLASRGMEVAHVVRGSMRRHRETLEAVAEGLGLPEVVVDAGWDEFDSADVFDPEGGPGGPVDDPAAFQRWFETSMRRWTSGENESDYAEPFSLFAARVDDALRRTTALGSGTTLVITSGGPISWCLAGLFGADLDWPARVALSQTLNPRCANTGVSKVVSGRRGLSAVQYNEHTHLEPTPALITYR